MGSPRGAELQKVANMSNRQMLDHQQQMRRDLEQPLTDLEASIGNLRGTSTMIHGEIVSQNRMINRASVDATRARSRMSRTLRFFERVTQRAKTRWLMCTLLCLLVALVVL